MNLIDKIRERISQAISPERGTAPIQRGRKNRDIGTVSTGRELEASIRGTVFACLQHRANAVSAIKFLSYAEKNYSLEEHSRGHWTNELLQNPNPYFTRSQLYGYLENWLSINGNAFVWTPTNGYRVPLQMWVLNPTRVRVIKGQSNFVEGYIYQSAQEGNIAIPESEVIHLARLHPASRPEEIIGMNMFGVGLVQAAMDYAGIDKEVSLYLQRLFKNNTIPPLIAKYPERFDYDEWEKLKSRWNEELPDYQLRALLAGGLSLELPPKSDIYANYESIANDVRTQIAQVFGVPPGMLTSDYSNRATAEVQWAIFRQNTIDPLALYIAEEFTRHFRRWEDNVLIQAEPYVFEDPALKMANEEFELRWGIKTINDVRAERGYDKVPEGNAPLIAAGYVPLDSLALVSPSPTPMRSSDLHESKVESSIQGLDYEQSAYADYFWRKFDGLTTENTINIQGAVEKCVKDLTKEIQRKVDIGIMTFKDVDIPAEDYEEYRLSVVEALDRVEQELLMELGVEVDERPPSVQEYMDDVVTDAEYKMKDSVNVMKDEVSSTLRRVVTEDPVKIQKTLQKKFKSLEENRAKTIAQTTSANATSATQYTVYQSNGFQMMWLTQRDGRVRFTHQQVDGKFPDARGYFKVGGEQTTRPLGDGLSAGNSINCRCQLFPSRSR